MFKEMYRINSAIIERFNQYASQEADGRDSGMTRTRDSIMKEQGEGDNNDIRTDLGNMQVANMLINNIGIAESDGNTSKSRQGSK